MAIGDLRKGIITWKYSYAADPKNKNDLTYNLY